MRTREGMATARARDMLRGKQPKLTARQQAELVRMHATGEPRHTSPATPTQSGLRRSARTDSCSPPPTRTRRRSCGTRPPASPGAPSPATPRRSSLWRSARTGKLLATADHDKTARLWN